MPTDEHFPFNTNFHHLIMHDEKIMTLKTTADVVTDVDRNREKNII